MVLTRSACGDPRSKSTLYIEGPAPAEAYPSLHDTKQIRRRGEGIGDADPSKYAKTNAKTLKRGS